MHLTPLVRAQTETQIYETKHFQLICRSTPDYRYFWGESSFCIESLSVLEVPVCKSIYIVVVSRTLVNQLNISGQPRYYINLES